MPKTAGVHGGLSHCGSGLVRELFGGRNQTLGNEFAPTVRALRRHR
ncbi:hypothetical protein SF06_02340 [Pseudomonas flexibilis]|nr:hypothetical protein SF06_02340 [Pseudomonas flexibilis]